jgi:hypothetical protein
MWKTWAIYSAHSCATWKTWHETIVQSRHCMSYLKLEILFNLDVVCAYDVYIYIPTYQESCVGNVPRFIQMSPSLVVSYTQPSSSGYQKLYPHERHHYNSHADPPLTSCTTYCHHRRLSFPIACSPAHPPTLDCCSFDCYAYDYLLPPTPS